MSSPSRKFALKAITLKNEKQFSLVKKFGQKDSNGSLILIYMPNFSAKSGLDNTSIYYGMKVSKRFSKSSPKRNLAKRRIRSLFNSAIKDNDIPLGSAFIIIPKKNFNQVVFQRAFLNIKSQIKNLITHP